MACAIQINNLMLLIIVIFLCKTHVVISDLTRRFSDSFEEVVPDLIPKAGAVIHDPRWTTIHLIGNKVVPRNEAPSSTLQPRVSTDVYYNCASIKKRDKQAKSGVYTLRRKSNYEAFTVWCDMDRDGGGWTLIQKRGNYHESENFYRGWDDYKEGFGNPSKEYWLGLDIIHELTNNEPQELRVDLQDYTQNEWKFAKYKNFLVGNEDSGYKLTVGQYTGDAGDSLWVHNTMKFATKDHGPPVGMKCATLYKGAWWYNWCYGANLNGLNLKGYNLGMDGINWSYFFRGYHHSLQVAEMKIRPRTF